MKKIITLIAVLFLVIGCYEGGNYGYGYNSKVTIDNSEDSSQVENKQPTQKKDIFTLAEERRKTHSMDLRGTDGKLHSSCTAYKGEFDGHTWYVFYDNLASPSVVHDPLCKCHKGE